MKKIVYIVGGVYSVSGMNQVLTQKVNWLATHTDYQLYMVLTERPDLPCVFDIDPSVKSVNFDINFDELDTMPLIRKLFKYRSKQKKYRRLLTNYLMQVKADIVVSACRREINFINDIKDGSRKIGEIHFGRSHYRQFSKPWLPKSLCRWISKQWIGKFVQEAKLLDKFIVLSREDKGNWVDLNNVQVIPNPIKQIPMEVSECSQKRVIAAGRYTWQKGFDLLLQAWTIVKPQHPDWHLDIFGSGDNIPFAKMADSLEISDVVSCHGSNPDIYKEYVNSSIFVLSSRYEGFGLVLAEAMSCGVPAVSFACPCGPRDIISDGEDGLLVEDGNVEALAAAICTLIEDEEKRKQFGVKAQHNATKYTEKDIMLQWVELFEQTMNRQ